MNSQTIARKLGESGCYFLSLLHLAQRDNDAIGLYKQAVAKGIFAIRYSRDMGELRSALRASEERANLADAKADASRAILDSIDGRIRTAQSAISSAIDSSRKLRAIIDAVQAISLDLRARPVEIPAQ